jgi:hypothetical protein
MKKVRIQFAILLASLVLAGTTFAATTVTTTTIGGATFRVSDNVGMSAATNASRTGFAVNTKHTNGNKQYSATSVNPSVTDADVAITATVTAATAP